MEDRQLLGLLLIVTGVTLIYVVAHNSMLKFLWEDVDTIKRSQIPWAREAPKKEAERES